MSALMLTATALTITRATPTETDGGVENGQQMRVVHKVYNKWFHRRTRMMELKKGDVFRFADQPDQYWLCETDPKMADHGKGPVAGVEGAPWDRKAWRRVQ